jgi:predicted transcriptional regulator
MVDQLFGSKTRVKLLQLFFSNPNRSFYVREITRKIDEQINSVRRELSNLLSIGIIKSNADNNRLYYEVDQEYEYYQPLAMIFGGLKVAAAPEKSSKKASKEQPETPVIDEAVPEHPLAKAIRSTGHIELAFLTGMILAE